jgi:hypothetical protein
MSEDWKKRWKQRVKMGMGCGGCLLIPVIPFYRAFVIQNLWNWFVSDALHAAKISYWQSFGIVITVYILAYKSDATYLVEQRADR